MRKFIKDINEAKEKMEATPIESTDLDTNIKTLKDLSKQKGSFFKVEQGAGLIIIKANSHNKLIIGIMAICYGILIPGFIHNPFQLGLLVFFLVISLMFFLIGTFSSTTNDITIDLNNNEIKVSSNNIIGRYTRKSHKIKFKDYTGLNFKTVTVGKHGITKVTRVVLKNNKLKLIDLPRSPYFIQYKFFIYSFNNIIKSQKTFANT